MPNKNQTSITLSEETYRLADENAKNLKLKLATYVEMVIIKNCKGAVQ